MRPCQVRIALAIWEGDDKGKERDMRLGAPQHRTNVHLVGNVYDPCLDCADRSVGIDDRCWIMVTEFDVTELFFLLFEGEFLPAERKVVFVHDVVQLLGSIRRC